jgi:hypothetical protein
MMSAFDVVHLFSHPFRIGDGIGYFEILNNPEIRAVVFDAQGLPLRHLPENETWGRFPSFVSYQLLKYTFVGSTLPSSANQSHNIYC